MPSKFQLGRGTLSFTCEDGTVFEGEATAMNLEIQQELIQVASFGPDEFIREGMSGLPTAIEATFYMDDLTIRPAEHAGPAEHEVVEEMREAIRVIRFRRKNESV